MAAGEDQPQAIVGYLGRVEIRLRRGRDGPGRDHGLDFLFKVPAPPDAIDGFVPGRLDDPCARRVRNSGDTPLIEGRCKRFLRHLFGQIKVAKKPDQSGDNTPPIRAMQCVDRGVGFLKHTPW